MVIGETERDKTCSNPDRQMDVKDISLLERNKMRRGKRKRAF